MASATSSAAFGPQISAITSPLEVTRIRSPRRARSRKAGRFCRRSVTLTSFTGVHPICTYHCTGVLYAYWDGGVNARGAAEAGVPRPEDRLKLLAQKANGHLRSNTRQAKKTPPGGVLISSHDTGLSGCAVQILADLSVRPKGPSRKCGTCAAVRAENTSDRR